MAPYDPPGSSGPRRKTASTSSTQPTPPPRTTTSKPPNKSTGTSKTATASAAANPCLVCQAEVTESQKAVACGKCSFWAHATTCLKMSVDTYNYISKSKHIHYYCNNCNENSTSPENLKLTALENKVNTLTRFFGIPDDSGTDSQSQQQAPDQPTPVPLSYAATAAKDIQAMPAKIIQDLRAIDQTERMRRCVVLSGLPEDGADHGDAQRLIHSLDRSADIKEVFRMGSPDRKNASPRPRLLKVVLSSSGVARSLLSQARSLRDSEDFPNVFIRRSMTKEERNYEYNLRQMRNAYNTANNPNETGLFYIMSNGSLKRLRGCRVDHEGNISGGRIDHDWVAPEPVPSAPPVVTGGTNRGATSAAAGGDAGNM